MACGCVVFSSLNHALADTLTPERLPSDRLRQPDYDVNRITNAVSLQRTRLERF